jgi:hypothetical protein
MALPPTSFLAWLKKASDWHVVWLEFSRPRGFPSRKEIHLAVQKGGDLRGASFVARLHDATKANAKANLWKLKLTHYPEPALLRRTLSK